MNNSRDNNISNTFVTGVLLVLIAISGIYISTLITNTMKTANYNKVIIEQAKEGNFRPIVGTSIFYYELDKIESDKASDFALYGQYYGGDEYYYSFIFYNLNEVDNNSGMGTVKFTCNENVVSRTFEKRNNQEYVSVMFSENELIDECMTNDLDITGIEYKLNDSVVVSIDKEYTLNLDKTFYINNGIEGFTDSEFEVMVKGTNILLFRIIFYTSFSVFLIYLGYRTFGKQS